MSDWISREASEGHASFVPLPWGANILQSLSLLA